MKSRSRALADKSLEAMIAALEIYNKPRYDYREEAFSILATNAWELLLKARIMQLDSNRVSSLYVKERRKLTSGKMSSKLYVKRNRAETPMSIGLFQAHDRLVSDYGDTIPKAVRYNLELIVEVRDSAIHFMNKGLDVAKLVQELGTASLRNYVYLVRTWFGIDLASYNFYLMPLAFVGQASHVDVISLNADERKVVDFLTKEIAKDQTQAGDDCSVALRLDLKFLRSAEPSAQKVVITNDPSATPISISEEDFRQRYPWDYRILTTRLRKRYIDFIENNDYHTYRRRFEKDKRFCDERYLDPIKKTGQPKRFYSPNIQSEFDNIYTKKS